MTTVAEDTRWQMLPQLTPHKLQRVGAFALAELGGCDRLGELTAETFHTAVQTMTSDVAATAGASTAKDHVLLAYSHCLWPNSPVNHPTRAKLTIPQRKQRIQTWRTPPEPADWPGVPCALCGRGACGFYGKVDVPLGASISHRNTTTPGHEGMALCVGCWASFHAVVYASVLEGGRATVLHSWDEEFLARVTATQVAKTRRILMLGSITTLSGSYVREQLALHRVREFNRPVAADVELLIFSNSNKEQTLDCRVLTEPAARWLQTTAWHPQRREAFGFLQRACYTAKVSGSALLARLLFTTPQRLPARIATYVTTDLQENIREETIPLAELGRSYLVEVLMAPRENVERITALAERLAQVIINQDATTELKKFQVSFRKPRRLREWLRAQRERHYLAATAAITADGASTGSARRPQEAFMDSADLWLLFNPAPESDSWLYREQLHTDTLAALLRHGWSIDPATAREALDYSQTPSDDADGVADDVEQP
ncbi:MULTISPECIES: hypothetical protein [unclassified Crossiella]|uniref:hypothetical protein n=1 Tax=unclassified Crossiella TaxID=2620835 RepID=UPI001FFFB3B6|nr:MULTISPECIES: hypothetical protein [unclassified Crossiella]MCK2245194.1 hypothetical protein [Crossiella sp. S99.2]MCK2258884.1 hypothetical protein [Crossiella sp. S99.1]